MGGYGRPSFAPDDSGRGGSHGHEPHGRGGHRGRRPLDYGALRLLVLQMIAAEPRHGYELMKAIEERTGGGYSPSPGVIYPTLSWLEDMGYAAVASGDGRRTFSITQEGEAFLAANTAALETLSERLGNTRGGARGGGRHGAPEPILRAMDGLKHALRRRFAQGDLDEGTVVGIAAAIETAAKSVEATMMTTTSAALRSRAVVSTPKAAGYAAQLAKHFAHKIPAHFENGVGQISFGAGTCSLAAEGDVLTMTVEAADAAGVAQLQDVVARHLLRFAFREELAIDWAAA